ncbi:MAG: flagellar FlbD family protein [Peptococcaceae bacterium]|nr:flagellar FlbD family protein [Peptococcaceae bacterium]
MIALHRLNGKEIVINADLVEFLEETPDTIITLTNGKKFVVSETVDNIVKLVIEYKQRCTCRPQRKRVNLE